MTVPTQDQIAYLLWHGGFGDEPVRNWYMAGHLHQNPTFLALVEEAQVLKDSPEKDPIEAACQREGWVRRFAELLYDSSYRLTIPSVESTVNWHTAETFWDALG